MQQLADSVAEKFPSNGNRVLLHFFPVIHDGNWSVLRNKASIRKTRVIDVVNMKCQKTAGMSDASASMVLVLLPPASSSSVPNYPGKP
jgi:hypothetical protein